MSNNRAVVLTLLPDAVLTPEKKAQRPSNKVVILKPPDNLEFLNLTKKTSPWKINMEPTIITHLERDMIKTKPP